MNRDELLLYLYRDVGLYWEKELTLPENKQRISLRSNQRLKTFFRNNEVIYNITNSRNISIQENELNTFYMTETGSTRVGSLLKHLRNSIMHGNYEIDFKADPIQISFKDIYRSRITMKGILTLDKLRQLIYCTH